MERLLAAALTPEQEAIIGACGFIGLRIQEALDFRVDWFDASSRVLRVRGKGDKERFVPVSARAWSAISSAYIDALQGDGKLIHYHERNARKFVTQMGERAGLKRKVSSHDLRATYATVLHERGVSQRVIQELLGHANGSTTEIYIGVQNSAMREAVEF